MLDWQNKTWLKIISAFLIIAFLAYDVAWATDFSPKKINHDAIKTQIVIHSTLRLPMGFASESFKKRFTAALEDLAETQADTRTSVAKVSLPPASAAAPVKGLNYFRFLLDIVRKKIIVKRIIAAARGREKVLLRETDDIEKVKDIYYAVLSEDMSLADSIVINPDEIRHGLGPRLEAKITALKKREGYNGHINLNELFMVTEKEYKGKSRIYRTSLMSEIRQGVIFLLNKSASLQNNLEEGLILKEEAIRILDPERIVISRQEDKLVGGVVTCLRKGTMGTNIPRKYSDLAKEDTEFLKNPQGEATLYCYWIFSFAMKVAGRVVEGLGWQTISAVKEYASHLEKILGIKIVICAYSRAGEFKKFEEKVMDKDEFRDRFMKEFGREWRGIEDFPYVVVRDTTKDKYTADFDQLFMFFRWLKENGYNLNNPQKYFSLFLLRYGAYRDKEENERQGFLVFDNTIRFHAGNALNSGMVPVIGPVIDRSREEDLEAGQSNVLVYYRKIAWHEENIEKDIPYPVWEPYSRSIHPRMLRFSRLIQKRRGIITASILNNESIKNRFKDTGKTELTLIYNDIINLTVQAIIDGEVNKEKLDELCASLRSLAPPNPEKIGEFLLDLYYLSRDRNYFHVDRKILLAIFIRIYAELKKGIPISLDWTAFRKGEDMPLKVVAGAFIDGEQNVLLPDLNAVKGRHIIIKNTNISNPRDFILLELIIGTLKDHGAEVTVSGLELAYNNTSEGASHTAILQGIIDRLSKGIQAGDSVSKARGTLPKPDQILYLGAQKKGLALALARKFNVNYAEVSVTPADNEWPVVALPVFPKGVERVILVVDSATDENLLEIELAVGLLKANGVKEVNIVEPYIRYSRQHHFEVNKTGQVGSNSFKIFLDIFNGLSGPGFKINALFGANVHAIKYDDKTGQAMAAIEGYTGGVDVIDIDVLPEIARYFVRKFNLGSRKLFVMATDKGSNFYAENVVKFLKTLGLDVEFVYVKKTRIGETNVDFEKQIFRKRDGIETGIDLSELIGADVLVVDDELRTGGTLRKLCALLTDGFHVGRVFTGFVHGIFSLGPQESKKMFRDLLEQGRMAASNSIVSVTENDSILPEKINIDSYMAEKIYSHFLTSRTVRTGI